MTFFVSTDETRAARDGRYARMQTVRSLLGQSGLDDFVFEPFDEGFHMGIYDKLSKNAVMYRVADDEEAKDKLPEILEWFATSRKSGNLQAALGSSLARGEDDVRHERRDESRTR